MTDDTKMILMKINEVNLKLEFNEKTNEINAKNKQLEYKIELLEDKVDQWERYIIRTASADHQNNYTPVKSELDRKVERIAAGLSPN